MSTDLDAPDPEQERRRWALKPVGEPVLPPWIDIHPVDGLSLGRADDNDVTLAATAHAGVSAHHIRLSWQGATLWVTDLASTNGTFVNGIRVKEKNLCPGDVVSIGSSGPKFVVAHRDDLGSTRVMEAAEGSPKFGDSTIVMVREAVGLDAESDVRQVVRRGTRRNRRLLGLATLVVVGLGAGAFWWMKKESRKEIDRLELANAKLDEALRETASQLDEQRDLWAGDRQTLSEEKAELQERLRQLEEDDRSSIAKITELREELAKTEKGLALLDPVNLERTRLNGVRTVRESVVFIETTVHLREPESGELVHRVRDGSGKVEFTLGALGTVFESEKTGSGFIVSKDGYILTNAHVIEPPKHLAQGLKLSDGRDVQPVLKVSVIFNNEERRHPATVLAQVHDKNQDFALLQIEPFEGMAHLKDFTIDRPAPAPGTEVYLFGFPLGRHIAQSGDRVVASTFKGILSRVVEQYLQVDAAVHPGNSGGPVTDSAGRIIGIVTAVARSPEGNITPSIGFVMPIAAVRAVWPPEEPASQPPETPEGAGASSATPEATKTPR